VTPRLDIPGKASPVVSFTIGTVLNVRELYYRSCCKPRHHTRSHRCSSEVSHPLFTPYSALTDVLRSSSLRENISNGHDSARSSHHGSPTGSSQDHTEFQVVVLDENSVKEVAKKLVAWNE
jgi:hypothetical protein